MRKTTGRAGVADGGCDAGSPSPRGPGITRSMITIARIARYFKLSATEAPIVVLSGNGFESAPGN